MTPPIEKANTLVIRRFREDDLDAFAAIMGDPVTLRLWPRNSSRARRSRPGSPAPWSRASGRAMAAEPCN